MSKEGDEWFEEFKRLRKEGAKLSTKEIEKLIKESEEKQLIDLYKEVHGRNRAKHYKVKLTS